MAEIFENCLKLMPEWANESLEKDLENAVDEYESHQNTENRKADLFAFKIASFLKLSVSQSSATKRNTKWVINLSESNLLFAH